MKQEAVTRQQPLQASFQQKSAGVSLVLVGATAVYTLLRLFEMAQAEPSLRAVTPLPQGYWELIVGVSLFLIVMEIILQTVLVIGAGGAVAATAQEQAAAHKAGRNAYRVLLVSVVATLGSLLFNPTPFVMGALLLLGFVLAEIVKLASQLIYGRS